MAVRIPVYFDYASSLCFIAASLCARLEGDLGIAFAEGADISNRSLLIRIAAAAALPVPEFVRALDAAEGTARLAAQLEEAQRFGVTGYPTFLLGQFPLTGIQPYETMKLLLGRYIEQNGERILH